MYCHNNQIQPLCYPKTPPENIYIPEQRRGVFDACKNTANYALENNISAVAFVDRASRPMWVGLKEYWRGSYSQDCPKLFFLDPEGFWQTQQCFKGKTSTEVISTDLPKLYELKDEPILIVDTCIHSGDTISTLLDSLKKAEFSNIHFGVVHNDNNFSGIVPDLIMLDHKSKGGCHPFGIFGNVTKHNSDHLYAKALEHSPVRRSDAVALRKQIRNIIREYKIKESIPHKTLGSASIKNY